MIVYTVHEPSAPVADRVDRAEALLFIRDGFSWMAAIFGPFWMLANGLWLVSFLYIAGVAVLELVLNASGLDAGWGALSSIAINIALGFEAASLRRWTYERRGWRLVGTVAGRTRAEAERRFFEAWLPGEPLIRPSMEDAKALMRQSGYLAPMTRLSDGARG